MNATTRNQTKIDADPNLPTIRIVREFDAPRDRVYRAWTDPELAAKWLGPKDSTMRIDHWDVRTGGNWRYVDLRDDEVVAAFYGSFHEVRPNDRVVQTFTYEGFPDSVSLETVTFEDLGNGRTRVDALSVVDNMEARDAMIASGMEHGVVEGFEKLDALLAD